MKRLYKFVLVLLFGTGLSVAQAGMGRPPQTTPPTFPSQQQPGGQHFPDAGAPMGQAGTTSTIATTKAESDIHAALKQQMPSKTENVKVSVTDDNKIKLSGLVNSTADKVQVEQIARSVAPDQTIVNKLKVSGSPSGESNTPKR